MTWQRESFGSMKSFIDKMNQDTEFYAQNIESLKYPNPESPYDDIRSKLIATYAECKHKQKAKLYQTRSEEYGIDLDMAKAVFATLHEYEFTLKDAADPEIWLYLNRYVIPDIIMDRWPPDTKLHPGYRLNIERFYQSSRRNYLSMLWWFIYICWQETGEGFNKSLDATVDMISMGIADDFSDLIERAGSEGYPIELYKEIMVQYSALCRAGVKKSDLLNNILKRNIAYMQEREPDLIEEGLSEYVSEIIDVVVRHG